MIQSHIQSNDITLSAQFAQDKELESIHCVHCRAEIEEGEVTVSGAGAGVGNAEFFRCISNLMILTYKHGLLETKSLNQYSVDIVRQNSRSRSRSG